MNVLIFVMTMLMLLSLMTYARLESYRSSQAFQMIFKHYMQEEERGYINIQAEKTYDSIKVSENKGKPGIKIDASPRIGIALLLDKDRDQKNKEWEQTKLLLKNLMSTLYHTQPFYLHIEEERPSFIDELMRAITQAVDELPQEKKPKMADDLANLKLNDPELDRILYKMLHGAFYTQKIEDHDSTKKQKPAEAESDIDNGADEDLNSEIAEFKSPEGYYSLLDFVTSASKPKIRVFLASKEVLLAIFHDPATVNAIIEERQHLYRQALSESDPKSLEESFKNQFQKMKDPGINEETLNFSVSKTNPKYYQ